MTNEKLIEEALQDELRWLAKCEENKVQIPYDAFRASLRAVANKTLAKRDAEWQAKVNKLRESMCSCVPFGIKHRCETCEKIDKHFGQVKK